MDLVIREIVRGIIFGGWLRGLMKGPGGGSEGKVLEDERSIYIVLVIILSTKRPCQVLQQSIKFFPVIQLLGELPVLSGDNVLKSKLAKVKQDGE